MIGAIIAMNVALEAQRRAEEAEEAARRAREAAQRRAEEDERCRTGNADLSYIQIGNTCVINCWETGCDTCKLMRR